VADRPPTDDSDVTITAISCQIIIVVLKIVKIRGRTVFVQSSWVLVCVATREVHTIQEIAQRHTSASVYTVTIVYCEHLMLQFSATALMLLPGRQVGRSACKISLSTISQMFAFGDSA